MVCLHTVLLRRGMARAMSPGWVCSLPRGRQEGRCTLSLSIVCCPQGNWGFVPRKKQTCVDAVLPHWGGFVSPATSVHRGLNAQVCRARQSQPGPSCPDTWLSSQSQHHALRPELFVDPKMQPPAKPGDYLRQIVTAAWVTTWPQSQSEDLVERQVEERLQGLPLAGMASGAVLPRALPSSSSVCLMA